MSMDIFGYNDVSKKPIFYRGVVEDNNDPEKLGRLKVRIFGIHSDSNDDLATKTLPWAEVANPFVFGGISGLGISSVPVKGTYVWCFLDDNNEDKPVVFAICPGVSDSKEEGSCTDPDKKYPIEQRLNESDYNRLARNDKVDETESEKLLKQNRIQGNATADGSTWEEPESLNSKAKYPNNNVIETPSYHVIQIDDTEGNERIHIFHRSGSYIEMRPDGSIIVHSVKDKFELIHENSNKRVLKTQNVTIDENITENIGKMKTVKIGNNQKITVQGTSLFDVKGSNTIKGNKIELNP